MEAHISLRFGRNDVSDGRKPIKDIANSLSIKPDKVWEKGGGLSPQDGFLFKFIKPSSAEIDFAQHEFNVLLKSILTLKPEIDKELREYHTQLNIALYTNGQVNPGVHLNKEAVKLLSQFDGSFDIDIYAIDGE